MTPKDDDPWRRLREREDEEEREKERLKDSPPAKPSFQGASPPASGGNLLELLERAEPIIDQLNTLYQTYAAGVEKRPPIERRTQLDRLMETIALMSKPTPALQFRFNTLHARYVTHKERWDRILKSMEAGKRGR